MRKLLLISSSVTHGSGFLEHCQNAIRQHLQGVSNIVFVPYALADWDGYEAIAKKPFADIGIELTSIHRLDNPINAVNTAEAMFIGGGNSFRLLKTLYDLQMLEPIRNRVYAGMPYMGSSAGTNMACPTIRTSNDMPIVEPPSFNALGLIPFQINPHYLDPDPNSTHKGETREQRLCEYLEENETPVAGLREGSWLAISDKQCKLNGTRTMRLFRQGQAPEEIEPNSDVSFLLSVGG